MKSLVVGEENKNYGEICSTDKKNISRLNAAGSKKTPLCYSKVKLKRKVVQLLFVILSIRPECVLVLYIDIKCIVNAQIHRIEKT